MLTSVNIAINYPPIYGMFFFTYAGPQSLQPFSAEGLKMLKYYIKRTICCSLIKFKKKKDN